MVLFALAMPEVVGSGTTTAGTIFGALAPLEWDLDVELVGATTGGVVGALIIVQDFIVPGLLVCGGVLLDTIGVVVGMGARVGISGAFATTTSFLLFVFIDGQREGVATGFVTTVVIVSGGPQQT